MDSCSQAQLEEDNKRLRAALVKFVDHFGPLEDNFMLHEDARTCFRLARKALGAAEHDRLIRDVFESEAPSNDLQSAGDGNADLIAAGKGGIK